LLAEFQLDIESFRSQGLKVALQALLKLWAPAKEQVRSSALDRSAAPLA
jgi:hypothetical protein